MNNLRISLFSLFLCLAHTIPATAQTNLNFEFPIAPLIPVNGELPIARALPGWSVRIGTLDQEVVFYNETAIDAARVSLHSRDTKEFVPIEGLYSVYLQGASSGAIRVESASIAQTVIVPQGVQSLKFSALLRRGEMQVSLNDELLNLVPLSNLPGHIIYGADIARFGGVTSELRFTAPPIGLVIVDSIRFSTMAVPEPSTLALALVSLGSLAWRCTSRKRL